jgi:hypothetical protein
MSLIVRVDDHLGLRLEVLAVALVTARQAVDRRLDRASSQVRYHVIASPTRWNVARSD